MGDISNYASLADRGFNGPIEFPGLNLLFNPPKTFLNTNIHWYGIIIAVGMLLAIFLCMYLARRGGLGDDVILDVVIWATPIGIICARIYYVIFSFDSYKDRLFDVFKIWEGGIAIYGCIIGAVLTVLVYCRVKKIRPLSVLDIGCIGLTLGQSIGRWGNFVNREAFGGPAVESNFLRMKLYTDATMTTWATVHPTFLYESLWNLGVFAVLLVLTGKKKYNGQIFWTYLLLYGTGRLWIEGLRVDSLLIGPLRVSQLVAFATALAGLIMLVRGTKTFSRANNIHNH